LAPDRPTVLHRRACAFCHSTVDAAKAKLGHKRNDRDMVSTHMAAVDFYQLALPVPKPRPGSFDPDLVEYLTSL
jgi:hypothetical protein